MKKHDKILLSGIALVAAATNLSNVTPVQVVDQGHNLPNTGFLQRLGELKSRVEQNTIGETAPILDANNQPGREDHWGDWSKWANVPAVTGVRG